MRGGPDILSVLWMAFLFLAIIFLLRALGWIGW